MARKNHISHSEFPYHITARTHSGFFWHDTAEVWKLYGDYLYFLRFAYNIRIYAFVLMDNHFHMIASSPETNISEAMNYFMRETSKAINRMTGNNNQVYGGRFYRTLISKPFYLNHVYKYVYRNPVQSGLSKSCEEHPYSTLGGILGLRRLTIPVENDTLLFQNDFSYRQILAWLNKAPKSHHIEEIEKALHRKELRFPKNRNNKQPSELEKLSY